MNKKGFSLIEILLYLGITSIIAVTFFRILGVTTRVQVSQVATNEVANQTNFVMQTIQRLARESSAIMVSDKNGTSAPNRCIDTSDAVNDGGALLGTTEQTCLKLRMKDSNLLVLGIRDPIFIWKDTLTGAVKIKEGSKPESDLTTGKVQDPNNALLFGKYTNYPGHDTIEISLTLNYNSESSQAEAKRIAKTAVSRVSAATFDSSLIPGAGGSAYDIGLATQRWANAFVGNLDVSGDLNLSGNLDVSGNLDIEGTIYQPGNYDAGSRGNLVVGINQGETCNAVCALHTGTCKSFFSLVDSGLGVLAIGIPGAGGGCSTFADAYGGFCFCK